MAILVTGGAGYIGSHTCVELQNAGYDVVVLDNLSNSSEKSLDRVKAITGKDVKFYKGDILDRDILNKIFENEKIDSCINFAGLKAVGESVAKPWEYYNNNIAGTLTLVDVMRQHGCKNIIFSSSATVYGDPAEIPITENCPKGQCTNPYGWKRPADEAGDHDQPQQVRVGSFGQRQVFFHEPPREAVLRAGYARGIGGHGKLLSRLVRDDPAQDKRGGRRVLHLHGGETDFVQPVLHR